MSEQATELDPGTDAPLAPEPSPEPPQTPLPPPGDGDDTEAPAAPGPAGEPEPDTEPDAEPEPPTEAAHGLACPLCGSPTAGEIPLRQSSRYATCGECNGLGVVLTGARTQETFALDCPNCNGAGYIASLLIEPSEGNHSDSPQPPAPGMEFNPQSGCWEYPWMVTQSAQG